MRTQGIIASLALLLGAYGATGCKTTAQTATKVDEQKGELVLQSSGDAKSAMPDFKEDRTTTRAVSTLEKEIENNPRDVASLVNLAQLQLVRGDLNKAEESARKALRVDLKNRDARKVMAEIAVRRGQHDMAAIILNGLGGANTKDSEILNLMALVALKKNENAAALGYFKKALQANPNDVAVRMNLGVLYLEYRQLNAAGVEFERVLGMMPEHIDARLHLAIIKSSRGDLDYAEKTYKDVLARDDSNPLALYNLAVVQNQRGQYDAALDHVKSYMKTPHARSADTSDVFALIEDIKRHKVAKGEKVNDDEFQALSAKLLTAPTNKPVNSEDEMGGPVLNSKKKPEAIAKKSTVDAGPEDDGIAPVGQKESGDEEINRLEKELKK